MAARDLYHNVVRNALIKDGWTITHDPYVVPFGSTAVRIDLGAERIIAAERASERIAVEVKSFVGKSTVADFKDALGSYASYLPLLSEDDPERRLFLAIRRDSFKNATDNSVARQVTRFWNIGMLIFDEITEEVVEWNR